VTDIMSTAAAQLTMAMLFLIAGMILFCWTLDKVTGGGPVQLGLAWPGRAIGRLMTELTVYREQRGLLAASPAQYSTGQVKRWPDGTYGPLRPDPPFVVRVRLGAPTLLYVPPGSSLTEPQWGYEPGWYVLDPGYDGGHTGRWRPVGDEAGRRLALASGRNPDDVMRTVTALTRASEP
jgi:hypothetical protein